MKLPASGEPKRKRLNLTEQVIVLARQAACGKCRQILGDPKGIEYHHPNELEISRDDSLDNRVAVHADCHDIITNGTKATTYGSSKHVIAKVKRLQATNEGYRLIRQAGEDRQRKREKKYSRKIPSRPFQRREMR